MSDDVSSETFAVIAEHAAAEDDAITSRKFSKVSAEREREGERGRQRENEGERKRETKRERENESV